MVTDLQEATWNLNSDPLKTIKTEIINLGHDRSRQSKVDHKVFCSFGATFNDS